MNRQASTVEDFEKFLGAMATTMNIPVWELEQLLFQKEDWRASWNEATKAGANIYTDEASFHK